VAEPKLSVVLATDAYVTIAPVVESLRQQTVHDQIELVLVAPSGAVGAALSLRDEFAGVRVVEDPVDDLAPARAAGVRAATSPWVFIGETHSFPHPHLAECLIRRSSEGWAIIMPAIDNANPVGFWSWVTYLSDYGVWSEGRAAGEVTFIPCNNAAIRRDVLLGLEERLAPALAIGDELPVAMRAAGHRVYFDPAARVDHANVASPGHWAIQRFAFGVMIARNRVSRWTPARRALYAVASPLIPVVLCWRILPTAWKAVSTRRLPLSTLFWIAVGTVIRSGGELAGYLGVGESACGPRMHEYEVHRMAYAGLNPS
jgi:hypothetical protein